MKTRWARYPWTALKITETFSKKFYGILLIYYMSKLSPSECGKLGYEKTKKIFEERRELARQSYSDNPNCCQYCGAKLEYESRKNKFCTRSCSAKVNNADRRKIRLCLYCNKQHKSKKYCSQQCRTDLEWQIKKNKINESGKVEGSRQARRYLLEKFNSCQMCGNDTWLGKPILLICDHINGNSEDWRLDNLRMICSNCDATTPFYKNKNMGNGRAYRRLRYKEGKSF